MADENSITTIFKGLSGEAGDLRKIQRGSTIIRRYINVFG